MKKLIKIIVMVLGGLIGLTLIAGFVFYSAGMNKLSRSYPDIRVEQVNLPTDKDAISRGRHISVIWACTKCHGENLGGKLFTKDPISESVPILGSISASNLTSGKGGIARFYTDADWIRSIRHGVKPNNQPAVFMYVTALSDQDLGDLIVYLKQIPPVDSDTSGSVNYGPIIPIAAAIGIFSPAAELIDHNAPHHSVPVPGATAEYGKYLSSFCAGCHGSRLPGEMKNWKREDFIHSFRTGVLPDGKQFGRTMSSKTFSEMNDTELSALWQYLQNQ